jgi:hypothetical protein
MNKRSIASHTIRIAAPISQCQRFFTPAGEELWVNGWNPAYRWPSDGCTEQGMVFTTGIGDDYTIWSLVDFDTERHYARYSRVTPSSRSGFVEVRCKAEGAHLTAVEVTYTLTALTPAGAEALKAFEGEAFNAMIEQWKSLIDSKLPQLLAANIR